MVSWCCSSRTGFTPLNKAVLGFVLGCLLTGALVFGHQAWQGERMHEVDVPFLQHMTVHHAQAIVMVQMALPNLQGRAFQLARQIELQQIEENGAFAAWLTDWDQLPVPARVSMDWMRAGATLDEIQYIERCQSAPGGMAGMASNQDLQALQAHDARRVERLFLELMLRHHESALHMLGYASREGSRPLVRQKAAAMLLDQRKEIQQIRQLLAQLPAD